MQVRPFAKTGKSVSEIGLGTWQLGGAEWGDVSERDALEILTVAADAGITMIDTADIYGLGRSETLIGQFLRGRSDRARFFVATKLGRHPEPGIPENYQPEVIVQHTEASLQRLGVDALDLTQTHCIPASDQQRADVFGVLAQLQEQGKIKAFGASVESMDEALACLDCPALASLQIIFNIFRQKPIDVLFDRAREQQVALIVRLPLASGLLSGKFQTDTTFESTDHRSFNRNGEAFNVGETFAGLPFEKGVALAQELQAWVPQETPMAAWALRWCLDFPAVTTVIPGATRPAQVETNAAAAALAPLSATRHEALAEFYQLQVAPWIRGAY